MVMIFYMSESIEMVKIHSMTYSIITILTISRLLNFARTTDSYILVQLLIITIFLFITLLARVQPYFLRQKDADK